MELEVQIPVCITVLFIASEHQIFLYSCRICTLSAQCAMELKCGTFILAAL